MRHLQYVVLFWNFLSNSTEVISPSGRSLEDTSHRTVCCVLHFTFTPYSFLSFLYLTALIYPLATCYWIQSRYLDNLNLQPITDISPALFVTTSIDLQHAFSHIPTSVKGHCCQTLTRVPLFTDAALTKGWHRLNYCPPAPVLGLFLTSCDVCMWFAHSPCELPLSVLDSRPPISNSKNVHSLNADWK